MQAPFEENNLPAIALNRARDHWDAPKLVSKYKNGRHGPDWQHYTVAEGHAINLALAAAWDQLELQPGDRVAIMAKNRPRWIFTLNSLLLTNLCAVTVYPTLTAEEAGFILRDSGARYVVVDTSERAERIKSVLDTLPELQGIVIMDALDAPPPPPCIAFDDLLAQGKEQVDEAHRHDVVRAIGPEDTAAIIYTSGTTGTPKGVVLTHGNFLSQRPLQSSFDLGPDDIFPTTCPSAIASDSPPTSSARPPCRRRWLSPTGSSPRTSATPCRRSGPLF